MNAAERVVRDLREIAIERAIRDIEDALDADRLTAVQRIDVRNVLERFVRELPRDRRGDW